MAAGGPHYTPTATVTCTAAAEGPHYTLTPPQMLARVLQRLTGHTTLRQPFNAASCTAAVVKVIPLSMAASCRNGMCTDTCINMAAMTRPFSTPLPPYRGSTCPAAAAPHSGEHIAAAAAQVTAFSLRPPSRAPLMLQLLRPDCPCHPLQG